jgi:hypothetical protein
MNTWLSMGEPFGLMPTKLKRKISEESSQVNFKEMTTMVKD